MREQDVVLEDQARVPALGGHAQAAACVLKQLAVEGDTAFHILQAGEGSQESRLAGSVRTQHCDGLACRCGERDIEPEAVAFDAYGRLERHTPNQRSRRPTRIAIETTRRMRLNVIAASGLVSSAR